MDINRALPRVTSSLVATPKKPQKTDQIIDISTPKGMGELDALAKGNAPLPTALFIPVNKNKSIKFDLSNVENRETLLADIKSALDNVEGAKAVNPSVINEARSQFTSAYETIMGSSSSGASIEEAMGRAQNILTKVALNKDGGMEGLTTQYLDTLSRAGIDFVGNPGLLTDKKIQGVFFSNSEVPLEVVDEFNVHLEKLQTLPSEAIQQVLIEKKIPIPRPLGPLPEIPGLPLKLGSDILAVFHPKKSKPDTSIKSNLDLLQECIEVGLANQTETAFRPAFLIAGGLEPGQVVNIGGHKIAVRENNYVLFASDLEPNDPKNINNQLFPGKTEDDVSYELNGGAPTYPGIRNAVDRALKAGEITEVELAQQVQKLLKTVGNKEQIPCHPMAAIITATLGLAEQSRNPKALSMLVMYTDLIIAGKATWAEGLGPTAVATERPVIESTKDVFNYFKVPFDPNNKIENRKQAATAMSLMPDVLASQLESGRVKSGNNGGELSMVGGGSAEGVHSSDKKSSKDEKYLEKAGELVKFKEASVLVKWLELPQNSKHISHPKDIALLLKARLDL